MKNKITTIGLLSGTPTPAAQQLCNELAGQGISAIVKSIPESAPHRNNEQVRQLTGQPGHDLFFNGWKLLF